MPSYFVGVVNLFNVSRKVHGIQCLDYLCLQVVAAYASCSENTDNDSIGITLFNVQVAAVFFSQGFSVAGFCSLRNVVFRADGIKEKVNRIVF